MNFVKCEHALFCVFCAYRTLSVQLACTSDHRRGTRTHLNETDFLIMREHPSDTDSAWMWNDFKGFPGHTLFSVRRKVPLPLCFLPFMQTYTQRIYRPLTALSRCDETSVRHLFSLIRIPTVRLYTCQHCFWRRICNREHILSIQIGVAFSLFTRRDRASLSASKVNTFLAVEKSSFDLGPMCLCLCAYIYVEFFRT